MGAIQWRKETHYFEISLCPFDVEFWECVLYRGACYAPENTVLLSWVSINSLPVLMSHVTASLVDHHHLPTQAHCTGNQLDMRG